MTHYHGALCLISCSSGLHFAEKILKEVNKKRQIDIEILNTEEVVFANTELKAVINESIRGKDVFIIQDVENHHNGKSVDENLRALYTMIGACKRCDANYITAVIPSFPYARQDKQSGREDITAARIAWELEGDLGADHIITMDLHNTAIQGFFRSAQIENLRGSHVLLPFIQKEISNPKETVIIPTDLGGATAANYYAQKLHTEVAFTYKTRNYSKANSIEDIEIMGDIKDKTVYIIDDIIDSGGTFCKALEVAKENGAKKVIGITTFALFNNNAVTKLQKCYNNKILDKIICTDAALIPKELLKKHRWIEVVSIAEYFAEIIHRLNVRQSIGELLG
ncbi:ribose-phosphate pyrophosphokinase [bacterium]|nr:ribose-phosphate pyrophosphokinase [bacterium]